MTHKTLLVAEQMFQQMVLIFKVLAAIWYVMVITQTRVWIDHRV